MSTITRVIRDNQIVDYTINLDRPIESAERTAIIAQLENMDAVERYSEFASTDTWNIGLKYDMMSYEADMLGIFYLSNKEITDQEIQYKPIYNTYRFSIPRPFTEKEQSKFEHFLRHENRVIYFQIRDRYIDIQLLSASDGIRPGINKRIADELTACFDDTYHEVVEALNSESFNKSISDLLDSVTLHDKNRRLLLSKIVDIITSKLKETTSL